MSNDIDSVAGIDDFCFVVKQWRQDSLRYRWLRTNEHWYSDGIISIYDDGEYNVEQGERLDVAIDAAMARP